MFKSYRSNSTLSVWQRTRRNVSKMFPYISNSTCSWMVSRVLIYKGSTTSLIELDGLIS